MCWYDFMGVLCWWMAKLMKWKIRIVAINILLKDKSTPKNRLAKFLYKKARCSQSFDATVTTEEYGQYINKILNVKVGFTLLHDVYHQNYALERPVEIKTDSVFCGGRNGRDWQLLLDVAKQLPDVTFQCIMSEALKEQFADSIGDNISVKTDVPEDDFKRGCVDHSLLSCPGHRGSGRINCLFSGCC